MSAATAAAYLLLAAAPGPGAVKAEDPAPPVLEPIPFHRVRFEDRFWAPRLATVREVTVWHNLRMCEETGRVENFRQAARVIAGEPGEHRGYFFNDSDVYKVMEGAAYLLATAADPRLDSALDDLIATVAGAQHEDGYLYTYYTIKDLDQRWTDERRMHETYCAGHLIEAAVAHHQATGKRAFLDVATRLADHLCDTFGPGKKHDAPGHQEIELALIRLWRVTGEQKYFDLALFFIEERGRPRPETGLLYGEYCQDHAPVREHTRIVGHAVRAMYLYSAMADAARVTGDEGYTRASGRVYADLVGTKMYVTGGIGNSGSNEGFTIGYDLPNDTAYAETCAAIGLVFWAHRLNLLTADASYADTVERALYNGVLSGLSASGDRYFYENRLGGRGDHHRQEWYACACCPPNLVRLLASVPGYALAESPAGVWVNLYAAGTARTSDGRTLRISTGYPWDGQVEITTWAAPAGGPESGAGNDLMLRIPGWAIGAGAAWSIETGGGPPATPELERGYARVPGGARPGATVTLNLPMPVRRVLAHPKVTPDIGRVALQRGPIVYCLEEADNPGGVRDLWLPGGEAIEARPRSDLFGGVMVLTGTARRGRAPAWDGPSLYAAADPGEAVGFTAIPYSLWDNRTAGEMVVWIPESPAQLAPPPASWLAPSASHCYASDTVMALNDRQDPQSSSDHGVPRLTWWDHKGTQEWARYDFDRARRVAAVEVYWFDDGALGGGCRVPAAWSVDRLAGAEWKPVDPAGPFGVEPDRFNRVEFEPVETTALRLNVTLPERHSSGILEWRVIEAPGP